MAQRPVLEQASTTPIFNTKAVVRETGVPADTFRAWERRYGIPMPQRTLGGHRLYSERDIAIIRWLRDRTAEGMNISHAVTLLNSAAEDAPAPLRENEIRGLDRLVDQLVQGLVSFDTLMAEQLVSEAFALYPFEDVLLQLFQPVMIEIGERWHRGEINVAAEHCASQYLRRKLSSLLSVFETSTLRGTIVIGCAPSELHEIGALLVALFLMRHGRRVIYLGAQVPLDDLLQCVHTTHPEMVCLSAATLEAAIQLAEVLRTLHETYPHLHLGYGGRAFNLYPEIRSSITGTFLGEDARDVVVNVDALLGG